MLLRYWLRAVFRKSWWLPFIVNINNLSFFHFFSELGLIATSVPGKIKTGQSALAYDFPPICSKIGQIPNIELKNCYKCKISDISAGGGVYGVQKAPEGDAAENIGIFRAQISGENV